MFDYQNDKICTVLYEMWPLMVSSICRREWRQINKTKLRGRPRMFSELPELRSLTHIKNLKTFSRRKGIFLSTAIAFPDLRGEFKNHKNKSSSVNICDDFLTSYFKMKSFNIIILRVPVYKLKWPSLEFPFWQKSIGLSYIPFNCQLSIKVGLISYMRKLRQKFNSNVILHLLGPENKEWSKIVDYISYKKLSS